MRTTSELTAIVIISIALMVSFVVGAFLTFKMRRCPETNSQQVTK